jgi:HAD superfamily phosphatase (TIGR01668 family)
MSILTPDIYYADVHAIDLDDLQERGIDTLLVDLDNTLVPRDTNIVTDQHRSWAGELEKRGFKVGLVSNNWHERVKGFAEELGFALVPKAVKPLPFAFLKALRMLDSSRTTAATVGDQMFTDVLGGNLLGMTSVMVKPLSETDLPHTLFLRRIEERVLAGRQPLP